LFGIMANCVLLGVLCVQVYLYYNAFAKDHRILKWTVFAQFLLEIIQTATLAYDNIQHFTLAYSSTGADGLNEIGILWISIPLITGLSTYMRGCVDFNLLIQSASVM
ncbi:hypothetical protein HYPSUDRAFT_130742, partial [Hypholoma sublateritium FD-334 SS-4]